MLIKISFSLVLLLRVNRRDYRWEIISCINKYWTQTQSLRDLMSDSRTKPPQSQLHSDLINIRLMKIDGGFLTRVNVRSTKPLIQTIHWIIRNLLHVISGYKRRCDGTPAWYTEVEFRVHSLIFRVYTLWIRAKKRSGFITLSLAVPIAACRIYRNVFVC